MQPGVRDENGRSDKSIPRLRPEPARILEKKRLHGMCARGEMVTREYRVELLVGDITQVGVEAWPLLRCGRKTGVDR